MDVQRQVTDTYHPDTLTPPPDGKLSPVQADPTRNATSPMHIVTSQSPSTTRGPSPTKPVVPLPVMDTPPVKEYQHHKKAMITSSTQSNRHNSLSPGTPGTPVSPLNTNGSTPLSQTAGYHSSSDTEVMSPDSGMSSASSSPETPTVIDDNNNTIQRPPVPNLNGNAGTPLAPPNGQPFKRRPGRPPGSTKKFKGTTREHGRRNQAGAGNNNNEFSLRKFFEAGGRDYNEYLEWLKKKGQSQSNGLQPTTVPAATQYTTMPPVQPASPSVQTYARAHVYPSTPVSLPQNRPQPGPRSPPLPHLQIPVSQAISQGAAQVPSPQMVPAGYRPILIQRNQLPQGVRPGEMMSFVPGYTMVPVQNQQPNQPPQSQKNFDNPPQKDSFSALDLSAKRRRLDPEVPQGSVSEHHYQTQHLLKHEDHHLVSHRYQREPTGMEPIHVIREEPTSPTKLPLEEVESSTQDVDLSSWDIENVVKFVTSVPGCTEYADTFREHKIDGATLPHLSENHLINFVKMKLGPAIRLRLAISSLKSSS